MPRYIAGRVAQAAFSLLGVSLVVFALLHFSGDPAVLLVSADARPEDVATVRRALGLDRPFHVQYLRFLQRAVMGDFGLSLRLNRPAGGVILDHFPATAELAAGAVIVAAAVSLPLGAVAAVRRGSAYDAAASALALVGQSMPVFWLGLIAIMLFGVRLGWFPVGGRGTFVHLVLPSVTLGWYITALLTRLIRSSLLEVLGQDYIRTARAKGLSRIMVLARHALKNAAIPVVTVLGLQVGALLGGAVVTEIVFAWPGLGRVIVESVYAHDFPLVLAGLLFVAAIFALTNLAVDLAYGLLDPRIRYE